MAFTTTPPTALGHLAHSRSAAVRRTFDVATSGRRALQLTLGALWLLDAALQYQPYMFTRSFVGDTLATTARGNPFVVADPMHWVFQLMGSQPVLSNAIFASLQLLIALGLFWRRTVKPALVLSIVWSVGVWWFGEGLGGVLTGASPYSGAPGAVILYGLVALLVWPRRAPAPVGAAADNATFDNGSVATSGALGRNGARGAWVLLWGVSAYLLVRSPNATPGMAHDMAEQAASGQPGWLAAIDHHLASLFAGAGLEIAIVLAVVAQLVAVSIFIPRLAKAGIVLAVALAAVFWLMEGLGGIFTGTGTDPNSGPLLALVAITFWPLPHGAPAPAVQPATAGATPRGLGYRLRRHLESRSDAPLEPSHRPPSRGVLRRLGPAALGVVAASSLVATGATAAQAATDGPGPGGHGTTAMSGMHLPGGAPMPGMTATKGPSQSARMICANETRHNIAEALGLSSDPSASSTWSDHLYTCTYRLPQGPLVLSVKELRDVPTAQSYLEDMTRSTGDAAALHGLSSLGLPGYETPAGMVMFRKDDKTLEVNATALPPTLGPRGMSRANFAYQIATDILACWTGH